MKTRLVAGIVLAIIGVGGFVFGIYTMGGWQQAARSGNSTGQAGLLFGTGLIGIIIIGVSLVAAVAGAIIAWQAYENRYN